jgi:hypothetical protein
MSARRRHKEREREKESEAPAPLSPRAIRYRTSFRNTIADVLALRGWTETTSDTDWDFNWADVAWVREFMDAIPARVGQRLNHFRNHYELTRKDLLVKNLKRTVRALEKDNDAAQARLYDIRSVRATTICLMIVWGFFFFFSAPNDFFFFLLLFFFHSHKAIPHPSRPFQPGDLCAAERVWHLSGAFQAQRRRDLDHEADRQSAGARHFPHEPALAGERVAQGGRPRGPRQQQQQQQQ